MKKLIYASHRHPNFKGGYMYVLKHGYGPGVLPKDVVVIQGWDLPNGYTVVVTDKFMDNEELSEYDIPDETKIDSMLNRNHIKAERRSDGFYDLVDTDTNEVLEPWRDDTRYADDIIKTSVKSASTVLRDQDITSTDDVDELVLYITNDGDLYRSRALPTIANLARKLKRGSYDKDLAVKAWQYLADDGVRKYDKEFVSGQGKLFLDKATRTAIAKELRDYYEEQVEDEANVKACSDVTASDDVATISVGDTIWTVFGDGQVEPPTIIPATVKEVYDDHAIVDEGDGSATWMSLDETFDNMDFEEYVGTDLRTFSNEADAKAYFEYLEQHQKKPVWLSKDVNASSSNDDIVVFVDGTEIYNGPTYYMADDLKHLFTANPDICDKFAEEVRSYGVSDMDDSDPSDVADHVVWLIESELTDGYGPYWTVGNVEIFPASDIAVNATTSVEANDSDSVLYERTFSVKNNGSSEDYTLSVVVEDLPNGEVGYSVYCPKIQDKYLETFETSYDAKDYIDSNEWDIQLPVGAEVEANDRDLNSSHTGIKANLSKENYALDEEMMNSLLEDAANSISGEGDIIDIYETDGMKVVITFNHHAVDLDERIAKCVTALNDVFANTGWHFKFDNCNGDNVLIFNELQAEDDNDPKYYVAGYYGSDLRGLEDNLATDDFTTALDFAHELASNGDYIEIINEVTGKAKSYTPDQWMEAIEFGDVPSDVYEVE